MSITDVFDSESGLAFVGATVAFVWALARTGRWYTRLRDQRFRRALHILEAAIEETYRTYVQAIKTARADGKLTEAERRHARQLARDRALALGKQAGIDLLRELGEPFVDLWITRLVNQAKRDNSFPSHSL